VQAVGVSNYGPKQMQKIHKHLEKRGVPLASAQVQYSLLSRGPQQEEIRAVCQDLDVQMIAYSPLALGMLSGEALTRGICMRETCTQMHMVTALQGSSVLCVSIGGQILPLSLRCVPMMLMHCCAGRCCSAVAFEQETTSCLHSHESQCHDSQATQ